MAIEQLSEQLSVIATIDPDAYTAAAYDTDEIDMSNFRRVLFIVAVGTMASTSTVDFLVYGGATTNAGSHSTAVTGKAITQLTEAGTDSDKQVLVEVTAEECAAQGLYFIEGTLTVGTASSDAAVIVLGEYAHYSHGSDHDLATVDEIVA